MPAPISASSLRHPRPLAFLLLYALASAGGVIAYLPLLTLLLPIKVESMAGEARLEVLAACAIAGGVASSLANIAFGWASDRARTRRRFVAAGVVAVAGAYALVAVAQSPVAIVVAVVLFQIAVNLLLAPLAAIMADEIPDAQKGVAGGLLALGNPLAAGVSAVLVLMALGEGSRLALAEALVAACILPILFVRGTPVETTPPDRPLVPHARRDLLVAWGARLLVQVAGNVLSLYLLYYLESIAPGVGPHRLASLAGQILTIVYILPLPIAVALGRASDLAGKRKPFLVAAATIAAAGLVVMGFAHHWSLGAAGFAIYSVGSAVFLVLHSGYAAQMLPDPAHRGRDLGLFNLANTLPSLVGPFLAWLLATPTDFAALMLPLAVLTAAGGVAILFAREPGRA